METFRRKTTTVKATRWDPDMDIPGVRLVTPSMGTPLGILNDDVIVPGTWIIEDGDRRYSMSDKNFRREFEPA